MEDPTRKDIREINYKIDDIEKSVGLLLRGRRKEVISELMETCFRRSIEKVRVFLAVDGESSVSDIAMKLGIAQPNASRHIRDLIDHDLIMLKNTEHGRIIYQKTSQVKRIRLEEFLRENFSVALTPQKEVSTISTVEQEGMPNVEKDGVQSKDTIPSA